jgi:hypothetical protein
MGRVNKRNKPEPSDQQRVIVREILQDIDIKITEGE